MNHPTGQRPGGLTALAVLNFVFGGLGALGVLASVAMLNDPEARARLVQELPNENLIYVGLPLICINIVLLLASGVGYMGQKRFLGKTLGSIYGLLGLVGTGVNIAIMKDFGINNILGLIYPVLTLVLLNTTFKDDFPNP